MKYTLLLLLLLVSLSSLAQRRKRNTEVEVTGAASGWQHVRIRARPTPAPDPVAARPDSVASPTGVEVAATVPAAPATTSAATPAMVPVTAPAPAASQAKPVSTTLAENELPVGVEVPALPMPAPGTGLAFAVPGWRLAGRAGNAYDSDEAGEVSYQVTVDETGRVVAANTVRTTVSPTLTEVYRAMARRLKLLSTSSRPVAGTGYVTYVIQRSAPPETATIPVVSNPPTSVAASPEKEIIPVTTPAPPVAKSAPAPQPANPAPGAGSAYISMTPKPAQGPVIIGPAPNVAPAPVISGRPEPTRQSFTELFEDNKRGWAEGRKAAYSFEVSPFNNSYYIRREISDPKQAGVTYIPLPAGMNLNYAQSFTMTVEMVVPRENQTDGGLLLGVRDATSYCHFMVRGAKDVSVRTINNGVGFASYMPGNYVAASASNNPIKPFRNVLKVTKEDDRLHFFVNDQEVAGSPYEFRKFPGNAVGFISQTEAVKFQNLTVVVAPDF